MSQLAANRADAGGGARKGTPTPRQQQSPPTRLQASLFNKIGSDYAGQPCQPASLRPASSGLSYDVVQSPSRVRKLFAPAWWPCRLRHAGSSASCAARLRAPGRPPQRRAACKRTSCACSHSATAGRAAGRGKQPVPRCRGASAGVLALRLADAAVTQHARLKSIPDLDRVAILVRAPNRLALSTVLTLTLLQAEALPYLQKFHGA